MACALTAIGVMTLVEGTTDPLWGLLTLPLWLVVAKMEGLYDADHPKIWHLTVDEAPAIFHWITLSVAGTLFFIRALPDETLTVESAVAVRDRARRRVRAAGRGTLDLAPAGPARGRWCLAAARWPTRWRASWPSSRAITCR